MAAHSRVNTIFPSLATEFSSTSEWPIRPRQGPDGGATRLTAGPAMGPITSLANYCQVKGPAAGISPARAADLGVAV